MCNVARHPDRRSKVILFQRWLLGGLLGLALSGVSQAASELTLVLNDPTEVPYTTPARDGFFDLLAGEAFRRAGLRLKLVKVPAERALMNANAGIEDGDLSRIAGLEAAYPNLLRVPEKLIDMDFVAFARQRHPDEASWATLKPFSVGHIQGWKIFEKNLLPATHITTAENPEQLFTLLDKNRIDLALYDRWMGIALAKRLSITDARVVEPALAVREMYIYLHKRHADKIPAITAGLRAIKSEGFYKKLCREKFAPLATATPQCEVK